MFEQIRRKPYARISVYIPYEFVSVLKMFNELILLDEKIDKSDPKAVKKTDALRSIVVRKLISAYVNANKLRLNISHEASQTPNN